MRKIIWVAALAVAMTGAQSASAEKYFARQQINIGQRGDIAPDPDAPIICAPLRQEVLVNGSGRVVGYASSASEAASACQAYGSAENVTGACSWMEEAGRPGQVTYHLDPQLVDVPGWASFWGSMCTKG